MKFLTEIFYPDTPGYGGGVVQIYADSVSFDGEINVSGFDNYDQYGPNNGAAGSIYIETNSISGYGSLYAEGGIHYESDGQSTPTEVAGSGGRIAIRVLQSGGNNFHGDYYASGASVFGGNASPGTIYFEDPDSFPFGKLIIRDDYGTIPEFSGPARVEGLGFRTAIADDIDGDNHLQVGASDYPESMAGRYLIHELDLPVRLSANDAASLTGEAVFPAILSGESYNGRIRLSSLQLGWDFESVDEIETDEFIHDFGSYMIPNFTPPKRKTLQDGSSDALDLTHIEDLELENFQLTLNRDLNLKTLTLRNGSSLVLSPGAHHLIVDQLILENSRLELNGSITAQTLTLGAGSVLQHGALPQWDWPGLTLAATDIQIADSARIDLNGRGLNEWPLLSITHGGLGSNSQLEQLYDSPAYPSLPGRGEHGGGLLAITAQHLQLDGHIQADGLGLSSGGAVLIQVQILSGNGEITVRGGELAGSHPQFGGGGRIALHYENATAFRGRLLTGDALAFLGSLWLENRQSGLIQLAAGLESGQLDTRFLPILPTWQRPGSEIASQMRNAKGSVWLLKTESELETLPPLKGLWIRHHDQIARVNDVLQLAPDRFLLSLDGEIEWFEDSPIEALIQVDNAGQIVSHPHSIPIQLREAR